MLAHDLNDTPTRRKCVSRRLRSRPVGSPRRGGGDDKEQRRAAAVALAPRPPAFTKSTHSEWGARGTVSDLVGPDFFILSVVLCTEGKPFPDVPRFIGHVTFEPKTFMLSLRVPLLASFRLFEIQVQSKETSLLLEQWVLTAPAMLS